MAELHERFSNIRTEIARRGPTSGSEREAAALLLAGIGFSTRYLINNRETGEQLGVERSGLTGELPFVGIDFSRIVDLGRLTEADPKLELRPAEMIGTGAAAWFVGDEYLVPEPDAPEMIKVAGVEKAGLLIFGETVLQTNVRDVFEATVSAFQRGMVRQEHVEIQQARRVA